MDHGVERYVVDRRGLDRRRVVEQASLLRVQGEVVGALPHEEAVGVDHGGDVALVHDEEDRDGAYHDVPILRDGAVAAKLPTDPKPDPMGSLRRKTRPHEQQPHGSG